MRILLYQARQNKTGGVEVFNYNFCKRLRKYYDITFLCDSADPDQFDKISELVPAYIFDDQYFETDICIYSSAWGIRPEDHIKAKRYIQMVHADFRGIEEHWNFKYKKTPKTKEHIGGGENIAKTFMDKYGYECKVVHYLLDDEVKIKPVLKLITTSRIAKEKGFKRVVKFAKALKASGRKFNWDIWGDGYDEGYVARVEKALRNVPEVSFRGRGDDLYSYVAQADYSVQLSDTEGWAFSIMESLSVGTPVIATAFPNAYEQIEDGKTGHILPFELFETNLQEDYEKVFKLLDKGLPRVKYEPVGSEEAWVKALGKPDKKHKKVKVVIPEKVRVKCIKKYFDVMLQKKIFKDKIFEVSQLRAKELQLKGLVAPI